MNNSYRLLLLSLFATTLVGTGRADAGGPRVVADVPSTAAATSAPAAGNALAGKQIFTQYCSICHGVGAQGFIGPRIGGINWTTAGLHAIVRGGLGGYGGMPAFSSDAVTDKNIADIASFLLSLQAGSPAPTAAVAHTAVVVATQNPASAPAAPAAPANSAGDPVHGRQIFTANCAVCHGANAQGGIGPSLHGEKNRKDAAAAMAFIKNPIAPMPKLYPSVLNEKDVEDVAAYVESL